MAGALLVGEIVETKSRRRDLHLKGSGRTLCSRGGDGGAAVGPVLRATATSNSARSGGCHNMSRRQQGGVFWKGNALSDYDSARATVAQDETATLIAASKVEGTSVYAADGESMGSIRRHLG
ncbi:hypothetical protein GCM10010994_38050 [Chelatococcus reniformis]|uniref:Uncharacterized protein n=1 Tax=Chelatococcus reniformis TaxID=1494448 RepID=A0A916UK54_9HYPH|nr:hypothetical protein GCM10010994_38050 [Chelatococcus reniformis]